MTATHRTHLHICKCTAVGEEVGTRHGRRRLTVTYYVRTWCHVYDVRLVMGQYQIFKIRYDVDEILYKYRDIDINSIFY